MDRQAEGQYEVGHGRASVHADASESVSMGFPRQVPGMPPENSQLGELWSFVARKWDLEEDDEKSAEFGDTKALISADYLNVRRANGAGAVIFIVWATG